MKVCICGGRTLEGEQAYATLCAVMRQFALDRKATEIISGACGIPASAPDREQREAKGADGLGERWAREHGVPVLRYYPDFGRYAKGAPSRRNAQMAAVAEIVVALPGGSGTDSMVREAQRRGVYVVDARAPIRGPT